MFSLAAITVRVETAKNYGIAGIFEVHKITYERQNFTPTASAPTTSAAPASTDAAGVEAAKRGEEGPPK